MKQSTSSPNTLHLLTDEELMARFQSKCEASFSLLMERYQQQIHAFIYRFITDKGEAENLTQEVFLRVYQRGSTFRLDAKFSTWLYRIARNLSIDSNKRRSKEPRLILNQPTSPSSDDVSIADNLASKVNTPEEDLLNSELKEFIEKSIQKLPDKYREVFILCSVEGNSYEEASQKLGCPVKTISSRLCRAKDKFLKSINKYLNHNGEQNRIFS